MRRASILVLSLAATVSSLAPATAQALPPTLGAPSVTNIQGVSALLRATVDPEGLSTTYRFQYGTSPSFAGALETPATAAGSGTDPHPARAAISGLAPATAYHYRLLATNSSGTTEGAPATFTTSAGFGFKAGTAGFAVSAVKDGGDPAKISGSHPYRLSLELNLAEGGAFEDQPGAVFSDGDLRDLRIDLPTGMLLNPEATIACTAADFNLPRTSPLALYESGESCPASSQVGTVDVHTSRGGGEVRRFGLFNLEPPRGVAAQLGFAPFGAPIALSARLNDEGGGRYALSLAAVDLPQRLDLHGLGLNLWGTPWAPSHNTERGDCLNEAEPTFPWAKCPAIVPDGTEPPAYLTLPIECAPSLSFAAAATSWQQPGAATATAMNEDSPGVPQPLEGCAATAFSPLAQGSLTTRRASSPSGFEFSLAHEMKGFLETDMRAPAPLRKAVLSLPAGVTVNPSVGAGLGVCDPARYAAETPFNGQGNGGCPNAAKIGTFSARSPLLEGPLEGAIYLAQPDEPSTSAPGAENPFDSMIALYFIVKLPSRGLLVKVAGKVAVDRQSGRLAITFEDLPQLPYSELQVSLRHGRRPFLASPASCGTATTGVGLSPWAGSGFAGLTSPSPIEAGAEGACPSGGAPPFSPGVLTGGVNANVGSYTPYFIHLSRRDTEQELTAYSLVLPKGVTGKLAGIPFCPEAAIAAARVKRGFAEEASPSCPAQSQVGRTLTGYGLGGSLAYAPGRIYLAGPYNGKPLSLVTVNAATIGPFDLGTYVIRSAFAVDPYTAQLRIDPGASDPIPHIVDGIPLHVRDIRVYMDRHQFTHNPSSCEASKLISTLTGSGERFGDPSDDRSVTVERHFQLLNCLTLGFRPKLGLRLRGATKRGSYPSLRATFAARGPQDSNLKRIEVITPRTMFLAHSHIKGICTRVQFDAERCPGDSVYGSAAAHTPLFDQPLRGSVYLRSSDNELPDLVALLRAGEVKIVLVGKIGPAREGIRTFFAAVPDAPVERFTMTIFGGKRGLLENSTDICKAPPKASVRALAQNNIGAVFTSKLRGQCGKRKKGKGNAKSRERRKGGRR